MSTKTPAPLNNSFLQGSSDILEKARKNARTAVNLSMVYAYYEIGKNIVEEEQNGQNRAVYGKQIIEELSACLTKRYGKGFSPTNVRQMRQFYQVYSQDQIQQTLSAEFKNQPSVSTGRKFFLSWSHYLVLMRISNIDERHFYEIMSVKNDWSLSELKRQYNSSLYERLALSTDKDKVWHLAEEVHVTEPPMDAVKDPYVLEFLGLKELPSWSESDLESRIIDNLQQFLLEIGTGFAFIGRQMRFTFDEEHFMVDLVFYNRLLRCFVLFDVKIGELKHQDIGQMQMYVHYYDRKVKLADENPTIGIMLCSYKNDAVVEMTLPEDNTQIFASKYESVLPSREALQKLLEEQMKDHAADNLADIPASRLSDKDGENK
ncbi:MAG: PDDEXK nuclease domain-containing protein [Desulfovibrionaceae bacterium]|nr:PDDEXK nuclease domain-containing protein [Desulfovibrionaceae bacterium]